MKTELVSGRAGVWTPILMTKQTNKLTKQTNKQKTLMCFPPKHNAVFFPHEVGAKEVLNRQLAIVTLDT